MAEYVNNIKNLYNAIKHSDNHQFINDSVEKIKHILQTIKNKNIPLPEDELNEIQILLGKTIEETIDSGFLNPSDVQQAKQNLTNITAEQKEASTTGNITLGLASLLITCSSLFAEISYNSRRNYHTMEQQQQQLKKNGFSISLTSSYIRYYEGAMKGDIVDSNGVLHKNVHILYDDMKGQSKSSKWNGKGSPEYFIQHCYGKATIGYGDTDPELCKKGFLTQEEATRALNKRILEIVKRNIEIIGLDTFTTLTTKQQACLITLWYNIGGAYKTPKLTNNLIYALNPNLDPDRNTKKPNTLLTRTDYLFNAAHEFLDCNKVNGEPNKGLTRRVNELSDAFKQDIV